MNEAEGPWMDVRATTITVCPSCRLEMDIIQVIGTEEVQYQVYGCGECLQIFEAALYQPWCLN